MTISVDPSSTAPLAAAPKFLEWVADASLLLPNADEARVLSGEADPERAALALASGREVAVTLGRDEIGRASCRERVYSGV